MNRMQMWLGLTGLMLACGAALGGDAAGDNLRGLAVQVSGTVQGKSPNSILIKINQIAQVLPENQAKDPTALVGKTIWVFAKMEKDQSGILKSSEGQVAFMNKLVVDQVVTICLANPQSPQMYQMTDPLLPPGAFRKHHEGERGEAGKDELDAEAKKLRQEVERLKKEVDDLKKQKEKAK